MKGKFRRSFTLKGQNGYILGMVMVFFVVFTILGLSLIKMSGFERLHVSKYYHKTKAFYYAEAGIHRGVWLLNNVSKAAATYSDATVSVTYDSVNLILKATGSSGGRKDSLKVTLQSSGSSSGSFTLRPEGAGAYSNNQSWSGGANWNEVDESPSDEDATFVYAGQFLWMSDTYATRDPATNPGTIDSLVIYFRGRSNYSGYQARTIIHTYSTRYYGSIINLSSVPTFTDFSTTHTTNPNTGQSWTWTEINTMQVGVRTYGSPRITQVWGVVYYSSVGASGSYTISAWEEL